MSRFQFLQPQSLVKICWNKDGVKEVEGKKDEEKTKGDHTCISGYHSMTSGS